MFGFSVLSEVKIGHQVAFLVNIYIYLKFSAIFMNPITAEGSSGSSGCFTGCFSDSDSLFTADYCCCVSFQMKVQVIEETSVG